MQTTLQNTNKFLGLIFFLIATLTFNKAYAQTELISNGNFSGSGSWNTAQGFYYGSTYSSCNSCPGYAWASNSSGGTMTYLNAYLEQSIIIPSNASTATLSFYVSNTLSGSTSGNERLLVYLWDGSLNTMFNIYFNSNNGYTYYSATVPSNLFGKNLVLGFNAKSGSTGLTARVDDVSLKYTTSGSSSQQAPTNITATSAGTDKIKLNWTQPTGAVKYEFYFCDGTYVGTYNGQTDNVNITNLSPNTYYSFKMKAINSSNVSSSFSSCAGATTQNNSTPPNTPTNLSASAISTSSIQLSWSASTGAIGYNIYKCDGTYLKYVSSTSTTIDGLSPNTYYSYKIDAQNSNNQLSAQTSCVGATTQNNVLNTPTGLVATALDHSSISLSWNSVSNATNYVVYDCNGNFIKDVTTNSTTINGLKGNSYYSYKIKAYNSSTNSQLTSCSGATTKETTSNLKADLIVSSISTSVKYATTGSSLTIYFNIKNIGNLSANKIINSVHFSTDNIFNAGQDVWLGENEIEILNSQSEKSSSIFITLPKNLSSKNYYLFISSDATYETSENNENNNQNYTPITVKGCNEITNTYPFSLPNNWNCNDFNNNQPVDPWNFYKFQCVSYVAWKINEMNGDLDLTNNKVNFFENNFKQLGTTLSNAEKWDDVLSKQYEINSTPAVGSIAHWGSKEQGTGINGHVAFVECVDGNIITLSDYNWNPCKYRIFTIDLSKPYSQNNTKPMRYIHTEVGGYGSQNLSNLNSISESNIISIFPNPINSGEKLNLSTTFENVTIINNMGQIVFATENVNEITLPVLSSGVYTVLLRNNGLLFYKKLVVN